MESKSEFKLKMMNLNINKFWKKRSVTITDYDPTYKVVYLGNVLTAWAKGDGCVDRPLATLWKNYCQSNKPEVGMKVTVCNSGLKAVTKEHGLTEYWSNRITYCIAHPDYPRVFCWVYRHEGKKLRQELRCHAVLCSKDSKARKLASLLRNRLNQALLEFKREKVCRQNARLSLANAVYDNPSLPRRKILLSTGTANYRPPLERSKSAPKLMSIEEEGEEDSIIENVRGRLIDIIMTNDDEDVCYYDSRGRTHSDGSSDGSSESEGSTDHKEEEKEVNFDLWNEDETEIDLDCVNNEPSGGLKVPDSELEVDADSISSLSSSNTTTSTNSSSCDADSVEEVLPRRPSLRRDQLRCYRNRYLRDAEREYVIDV